jgi:hypothetical protein
MGILFLMFSFVKINFLNYLINFYYFINVNLFFLLNFYSYQRTDFIKLINHSFLILAKI